jgi:hypothetical protein
MDTSPSPAAEGGDARAGREWRVASVAEQVAAIDMLVDLALARIRVFDVDLAQCGWNAAARANGLARFLARPGARLDVIVHETRWIEANAPRFVALLRTFGHAMTVYRTGDEARAAMDPLLLVDDRHYLHRFHIDQPRASVAVDMPELARPLCARFDEIWATGEPGLTGTVLGL